MNFDFFISISASDGSPAGTFIFSDTFFSIAGFIRIFKHAFYDCKYSVHAFPEYNREKKPFHALVAYKVASCN